MGVFISVIIPVRNAAATLPRCLKAIHQSAYSNFECLVVDDHSLDASAVLASQGGARVLATDTGRGPAHARNLGAQAARGDVLLFIDGDVCVTPGTLGQVTEAFEADATLDAVIGSYDYEPGESNFLSQYKNLMHCYVHQEGKRRASTFWTGCGAIRREVFLASGGFDETYARPSIEDIELGARLVRAGRRIDLEPSLMVKHLKRWTFWGLLVSDIRDRAIPWTRLILRERRIPNDLNVHWSQRACVALVYLALAAVFFSWPVAVVLIAIVVALNIRFYAFLAQRRGVLFALRAVPLHLVYFIYSGAAFAVAAVVSLRRKKAF